MHLQRSIFIPKKKTSRCVLRTFVLCEKVTVIKLIQYRFVSPLLLFGRPFEESGMRHSSIHSLQSKGHILVTLQWIYVCKDRVFYKADLYDVSHFSHSNTTFHWRYWHQTPPLHQNFWSHPCMYDLYLKRKRFKQDI